MPNLPNNNSFIPKQGPEKRTRKIASRQVHLFTIFSYILFFSTLIASAAVALYGRHMDGRLAVSISDLNQKIEGFNIDTMDEVREFDSKLKQAQNRIDNTVSVVSILNALEASTAQTVKITDLILTRNLDSNYTLKAGIETDSFDSSIFQRSTFERSAVINDLEITELQIVNAADTENTEGQTEEIIRFTANIIVPISTIPFTPTASLPLNTPSTPADNSVDSDSIQESEESVIDNINDI